MKNLFIAIALSAITTTSFASEFDNNIARALVDALENSTVTCEEIYSNTDSNYGLNSKANLQSVATMSDYYYQEINLEEDPSVIKYKLIDRSSNSRVERSSGLYWDVSFILSPDEATVDEVVIEQIHLQVKEVNIGTIPKPEYVIKRVKNLKYKQVCIVKELNSTNY